MSRRFIFNVFSFSILSLMFSVSVATAYAPSQTGVRKEVFGKRAVGKDAFVLRGQERSGAVRPQEDPWNWGVGTHVRLALSESPSHGVRQVAIDFLSSPISVADGGVQAVLEFLVQRGVVSWLANVKIKTTNCAETYETVFDGRIELPNEICIEPRFVKMTNTAIQPDDGLLIAVILHRAARHYGMNLNGDVFIPSVVEAFEERRASNEASRFVERDSSRR